MQLLIGHGQVPTIMLEASFILTFMLLLSPFRVINVIPKGKTKPEGLKNGGKKDED